ncbi:hypothetical protein JST97_15855 [bacterium]|nr:hypothetical protein [bacterium]
MTCQFFQFAPPKVLVVDPDPGVLRMMELALQRSFMFVRTAESESAALAMWQGQDFEVMVIGLSQQRALEMLDRLDKNRPLPAILMMLDGSQPPLSRFAALEKPFRLEDLRSGVRALAEQFRTSSGRSSSPSFAVPNLAR